MKNHSRLLLKSFPSFVAVFCSVWLSSCGLATYESGQVKPSAKAKGAAVGASAGIIIGAVTKANIPLAAIGGGVLGGVVGASMKSAWAARERLERAGVQVVQQGEEVSLYIPVDVCFESATDILQESCHPVLDQVAVLLKAYPPDAPMTVTGHTDDIGSPRHKCSLSSKQAQAVAAYLWAKGLCWEQLKVVAAGDSGALASNHSARGSAFNRRVQIDIFPAMDQKS
ncbi:MAG: OmpA family protein [Gammaproteobacteria bacterium]|nr:OmpA family protein [Gammaproteobacteria bacterium]